MIETRKSLGLIGLSFATFALAAGSLYRATESLRFSSYTIYSSPEEKDKREKDLAEKSERFKRLVKSIDADLDSGVDVNSDVQPQYGWYPINNILQAFGVSANEQVPGAREALARLANKFLARGQEVTPKVFEDAVRYAVPLNIVKKMLERNPKLLNAPLREGGTPYFLAVYELNYMDYNGLRKEQEAIAKFLLEKGADANPNFVSEDYGQVNLLKYMLLRGYLPSVEFLLKNGVKVEKSDLDFAKKVQKDCIDRYGVNPDPRRYPDAPMRCFKPQMDKRETAMKLLERSLNGEDVGHTLKAKETETHK